jgi:hypothetical protein
LDIFNLLDLVDGLNIHTFKLNGMVRIWLATYGPSEEGAVTSRSGKSGSVALDCQSSEPAREDGMNLDFITLGDIIEDSQDEVSIASTSNEELGLS